MSQFEIPSHRKPRRAIAANRPAKMRRLIDLFLPFCALGFLCSTARAQTSAQFWPEINAYANVDSNIRFNFQVKDTREGGQTAQLEIGPSFDFYFKPLLRLKRLGEFPQDAAQAKLLVFSAGYRYFPAINSPAENRIRLDAIPSYPVKWGMVASDRNRIEFRFVSGGFSWRYRNRLAIQRAFAISSYRLTPYVRCEIYYDSQFGKWDDVAVDAGTKLPITKKTEIDAYYEHQNITSKAPNQQVDSLALALNVYF